MIPLFLVVGFRTRRSRRFKLWLPLFLVWLLLLPLVLVLLPFAIVACLLARINPLNAIARGWQLLAGLAGVHVEIEDPTHYVMVHII